MKLAIDPGIRGTGVAAFSGGTLERARYIVNPVKRGNGVEAVFAMARAVVSFASVFQIDEFVFERMQIRRNSPGDPNISLLPLVGVAYAVAGHYPNAVLEEFETPRDWKGTVDGVALTLRIRERLTADEFARISLPDTACDQCRTRVGAKYCLNGERGCGADHVYDAIGIGLKNLGRFERKRMIPR